MAAGLNQERPILPGITAWEAWGIQRPRPYARSSGAMAVTLRLESWWQGLTEIPLTSEATGRSIAGRDDVARNYVGFFLPPSITLTCSC